MVSTFIEKWMMNNRLLKTFAVILSTVVICGGCGNSSTPSIDETKQAIQGEAFIPVSHHGSIQQVGEPDIIGDTSSVSQSYITLLGRDVLVPDGYTATYDEMPEPEEDEEDEDYVEEEDYEEEEDEEEELVDESSEPQRPYNNPVTLQSDTDDQVIHVYPTRVSITVSDNDTALLVSNALYSQYAPTKVKTDESIPQVDYGYRHGRMRFADDTQLLYITQGNDVYVIMGDTNNTSVDTLSINIMNPALEYVPDMEIMPKSYTSLTGGYYYPVKSLSGAGSYFIFPLEDIPTVLQVFGSDSNIKLDIMLLKNSTSLANSVTLSLKEDDIVYFGKNSGYTKNE